MTEHRKPTRKRKDDQIRVRATAEQKARFVRAAEKAGVSLSSWIVMVCLRDVEKS